MTRRTQRLAGACAAVLGALLLPACVSAIDTSHGATPQRPTFSSDPNTTADGTLELESGIDVDPDGDSFVPVTLKYGAGPRTEIFAGSSVYQALEAAGPDPEGAGDLFVGARHRFLDGHDGGPSAAFQFATKLPTADRKEGLSSGEVDFAFALTSAMSVGERTSVVAFYQLDQVGRVERTGLGTRHGYALVLNHTLEGQPNLGLFAELAHVAVPGDAFGNPLFLTTGVARAVQPGLVFDVAVATGLNDAAPDLRFLLGLTTNFGRIRGVDG